LKAILDGRKPGRKGAPPYLEEEELLILQEKILIETAIDHSLRLCEVLNMVSFFLNIFIYFLIKAYNIRINRCISTEKADVKHPSITWVRKKLKKMPLIKIKKAKLLELFRKKAQTQMILSPFYEKFDYYYYYYYYFI
jgi:hypothetical protein